MKSLCVLVLLLLPALWCSARQDTLPFPAHPNHQPVHRVPPHRTYVVASGIGTAYGGSLLVLNQVWYQQYERTRFQTFNDSREWLQMDKLGHAWTAYQLARSTASLWQWSGMPQTKAALWGSAGSMAYLGFIELMDAHSAKWGWSWSDMAANTSGLLLYLGQQLGWKEQKISFKFSVAPARYTADVGTRANDLFGASAAERLLKDYNTQTYWLSGNIRSFFPRTAFPSWLNIAVGYGAEGMLGGFRNEAFDKTGNRTFYRPDIQRYRQWYLAPDIDFTRIKTNRKGVRTLLFALNCLKVPAPALVLERGKLRVINSLSP